MTPSRVVFDDAAFELVCARLARAEEVVFAYATYAKSTFIVSAIDTIAIEEVASQSLVHVTLADEVRPRLIREALRRDQCLIEAHSHGPDGYAAFSDTDLNGFGEWVPHVRWRLGGRPYAALVCAGQTWDGLAWEEHGAEAVAAIQVRSGAGLPARAISTTQATARALQHKGLNQSSRGSR